MDNKQETPTHADFSKAQMGDRVWSVLHGWGTIRAIFGDFVRVSFNGFFVDCTYTGYWKSPCKQDRPILFWDKIPIPDNALIPPKRKVTKWFCAFGPSSYYSGCLWASTLFDTEEACKAGMKNYGDSSQGPYSFIMEE